MFHLYLFPNWLTSLLSKVKGFWQKECSCSTFWVRWTIQTCWHSFISTEFPLYFHLRLHLNDTFYLPNSNRAYAFYSTQACCTASKRSLRDKETYTKFHPIGQKIHRLLLYSAIWSTFPQVQHSVLGAAKRFLEVRRTK